MKRFFCALMTVALLLSTVAFLFSCAPATDAALSFWAYQPTSQKEQDDYKTLLSEFTAETGIPVKVNFVAKDNYNTAFSSALLSSKKPDVAYLDQPLTSYYADGGILYDMTEAIKSSASLSSYEYFEGAQATTLYKGKTYAVPLNLTASVLFTNTDMVNGTIKSFDEWLKAGDNLAGGAALFEGIGSAGYAAWYFQVFLQNVGGSFMNADETKVTFNDAKGVSAAKMIQDLYKLSPKGVRDTDNAFGRGLVATKLGMSSDIETIGTAFPELSFTAQLVPPQNEGGTSYSNIGGENLVVLDSSAQKDKAMKLIEFLMREESSKKISEFSGNFSAVKKFATVDDDDPYKEMKMVVLEQLETACARPSVPAWLTVNDEYIGPALEAILAEGASPDIIPTKLDTAAGQATNVLFG